MCSVQLLSEHLVRIAAFHELRGDTALKYYRFIEHPSLNFEQLKTAFFKTFDVVDYDFKIERELRNLNKAKGEPIHERLSFKPGS